MAILQCWIVILCVGTVSVVSAARARIFASALQKDAVVAPAPGVVFLDYLISKENPKNPTCGNVRYSVSSGGRRKRKLDEVEARDCNADGFLMTMDVQHALKLYFEKQLGSMAAGAAAYAAMLASPLTAWMGTGLPTSWTKLAVPTMPKNGWPNGASLGQFHARIAQLQQVESSRIAKHNPLFSDRNSKLCGYGGNDQIPIDLYRWDRTSKKMVARDPQRVDPDEYISELLSTSDYFFLDDVDPIIAFLKVVSTAQEARDIGLPWADGWSPYVYVPLVCSAVKGGGTRAMSTILQFTASRGVNRIVMSALSHVAWLYYTKVDATFITRRGISIDVSAFEDTKPVPMNEKEAVEQRLMSPPA